MNFRKLLTYLTVGTAAVIPFAGAQNPTILQGNYVSNVFGQANFVLNPNAQTSVANVTNATRSTTTPLVATSEFTLNLTSGTFATWTLRAFDSGMKGQNCEARFSYRGFATATTKAEIVQNSLVVAHLTLTPSTDPRIASINFPCGDLVHATTFRIAQTTANMTTVTPNEIGAIYTGLATNQANVAQAEYIGYGGYANGATIAYWDTSTPEGFMAMNNVSLAAPETSSSSIVPEPVVLGNLLRVRFNGLKPGNYHATFTGPLHKDSSGTTGTCSYTITPVTVVGSTVLANEGEVFTYNVAAIGQDPNPAGGTLTSNFSVTSTQDVYLYIKVGNASSICRASVGSSTGKRMRFHLHRFPTSSELVVTPERQNTFAGVKYTNSTQQIRKGQAASATYYEFNNATWNQPTLLIGKAAVTTTGSGNDLGFSVPNLPVGQYKVSARGAFIADTDGATTVGQTTYCSFKIRETILGADIALQVQRDAVATTTPVSTRDFTNMFFGVFNNTSVGTRNFRIEAAKIVDGVTGNNAACQAYSNTGVLNTEIVLLLEPLDQPSNSALYVQGPVLGAQTGAAIPTSYVGESKQARASGCGTNSATNDGATITITPGIWRVTANGNADGGAITDFLVFVGPQSGNNSTWRNAYYNDGWIAAGLSGKVPTITPPILVRFDGTNLYRFEDNAWQNAYATTTGTLYAKFYRAMTTCNGVYTAIVAERVN